MKFQVQQGRLLVETVMETMFLCSISSVTKSFARSEWWSKKSNHNSLIRCKKNGFVHVTPSNTLHATTEQINELASSFVTSKDEEIVKENDTPMNLDGIGIVRFMRGKVFLITGATGLLAKVLVEKILRSVPDVDKIYLLIRAKSKMAALERLKNEIINAEIFNCLRQRHGETYESFMLRKLVPVIGNVCDPNLGIEASLGEVIANEVDIVINSAGNTNFHERYDVALEVNTRGACKLMSFAKKCKKLNLFVHVSTAYVNGKREGRVWEKPFHMGTNIAKEMTTGGSSSLPFPMLDVEAEMKLALDSRKDCCQDNAMALTQKMKQLGLQRARSYGWQDTYVFTKAMGEMMIDKMREEIPVVIVRPSIIESTYKEPFPGWIEGIRMMDPIIISNGKGELNSFVFDPNEVLDVVPADLVVNATLAAMAKHGIAQKPGLNIYHISSSVTNPMVLGQLFELVFHHFISKPYTDSSGRAVAVDKMKSFPSKDDFMANMLENILKQNKHVDSDTSLPSLPKRHEKLMEKIKNLVEIYEPYGFYKGRFDNSNIQKLMANMSEEERRNFWFDTGSIDWKEYICDIHIPGLRRHVMKG